jgi:tetratricopeptide (TPR) repeat protein
MEAQAFGNLGIARLNMGHYEDAIGYLEQQLATLEQLSSATAIIDKGRALGNLGDCYDALGDYDEAIKCHEQVKDPYSVTSYVQTHQLSQDVSRQITVIRRPEVLLLK